MATTVNETWVQGQDLDLEFIYKEGPDANSTVAIDLTSGYSIRMDIVDSVTGQHLYTFNSDVIADIDPITSGAQPDDTTEATFGTGAGGDPNITISVSRALTLPGGPLYPSLSAVPPVLTFFSDIFLRNTVADKQWKIATVNITVEKSYTLWP
jgi:hypothetical protein